MRRTGNQIAALSFVKCGRKKDENNSYSVLAREETLDGYIYVVGLILLIVLWLHHFSVEEELDQRFPPEIFIAGNIPWRETDTP